MYNLKKILNIQIRKCHNEKSCINLLKDIFGVTTNEAENIIKKMTPRQKDPNNILQNIRMCQSLGFDNDEILENYQILSRRAMTIEQYFMILEEGGFRKITVNNVVKYRYIYSKSIKELKREEIIPENLNVARSFASYFDPQPHKNMIDFSQFSDEERWRDIHHRLLRLYIKWRLGASDDDIIKLFRIHSQVTNKSVRLLCENIHLSLECGLSPRRIIRSGYVLHSYPKNVKQVLRDYGNIAGGDLKKAVMGCPKLLMVSPQNYAKIYGILKEHEVPDEVIRKNLNVFQYAPETIKYRLEELDRVPELKILKNHEKFLRLIVHHKKAQSRYCFLQELQMKCLPLKVLCQPYPIDEHVRNARDINFSQEVIFLIEELLKVDKSHFQEILKRHPNYLSVPLIKIQETCQYLKSCKFENRAIAKVPWILLYPKGKIQEELIIIKKEAIAKKMPLTQVQRLNLALYNLEKKFHFTGDGIWMDPSHTESDSNTTSDNKT